MATKKKAAKASVEQVRTITVDQAARWLAVSNMALGSQLTQQRVPGTKEFYRFTPKFGWSPLDGNEIDAGFNSIQQGAESDELADGLSREVRFFRSMLRKNKAAYDKVAFGPMSLKVA